MARDGKKELKMGPSVVGGRNRDQTVAAGEGGVSLQSQVGRTVGRVWVRFIVVAQEKMKHGEGTAMTKRQENKDGRWL